MTVPVSNISHVGNRTVNPVRFGPLFFSVESVRVYSAPFPKNEQINKIHVKCPLLSPMLLGSRVLVHEPGRSHIARQGSRLVITFTL